MAANNQLAAPAPTKAPISSHPAFPAILALWFAALLGFGCLVLPSAVFERLVAITGLASIIPAAAPPLGFTARAILALAAAIAGAAIGLILARQVARFQMGMFSRRQSQCRPVSAHDELGETLLPPVQDRFDQTAPEPQSVQTQQSSAIAEDQNEYDCLDIVPLPEAARPRPDEASAVDDATPDTRDFTDTSENTGHQESAMTDGKNSAMPVTGTNDCGADGPQQVAAEEFETVESIAFANARDEEEEAASFDVLPFSAPSLGRKRQPLDLEAEEGDDLEDETPERSMIHHGIVADCEPGSDEPTGPAKELAPPFSVVERDRSGPADTLDLPTDDRALEDLGLVQLAARLGASLERRRARRAAKLESAQAPRPVFAETSEDFDAAAADDAARARAEFFGGSDGGHEQRPAAANETETAPATEPAPRPKFDFIDGEELASSFALKHDSTQTAAWRQPPASYDDEDIEEEDGDEYDYSSLLALGNPFERKQPDFVRVEEPEPDEDDIETTVSFPQEKEPETAERAEPAGARQFDPPEDSPTPTVPHNSDDADRDLRAALETLQRMSNAG